MIRLVSGDEHALRIQKSRMVSASEVVPKQLPCAFSFSELPRDLNANLIEIHDAMDTPVGLMDGLLGKSVQDIPIGSKASTETGSSTASQLVTQENTLATLARTAEIRFVFMQFTCEDRDAMPLAGFGHALRLLGHSLSGKDVQDKLTEIGQDRRRSLDFEEFRAAVRQFDARAAPARNSARLSSQAKPARRQSLVRVFDQCAQAGQAIGSCELGKALRLSGYHVSDEEAVKLSAEFDSDRGGEIDVNDFIELVSRLDEER